MLGYDIGFFFLSALKQYGKDFTSCMNEIDSDELLTNFRFDKIENGGYLNNSFNLIRYNSDYTVEKIGIISEPERRTRTMIPFRVPIPRDRWAIRMTWDSSTICGAMRTMNNTR